MSNGANMTEPKIQIYGHDLTAAQAMAVRVAVMSFQMECSSEEGRNDLGPIADAYNARLTEVLKLMVWR